MQQRWLPEGTEEGGQGRDSGRGGPGTGGLIGVVSGVRDVPYLLSPCE